MDNSEGKWMKWMGKTLANPENCAQGIFWSFKNCAQGTFLPFKNCAQGTFFKFILVIHGFIVFLPQIIHC